ncbi:cell division cycle protein 23 homolog [Mercenaria mercenaria]|uniref:cell division cycle protein 23 homolog n=1 Tax=Mercenaria mercenaria TaxID=6596 RepID=UPI00234E9BD5|nr:cell division cycle protein 23 homolog [Mercenaria mercenaria]
MADISSWNLSQIKNDLVLANREFSSRRLMHSAKWCAELSLALSKYADKQQLLTVLQKEEDEKFLLEYDQFSLATSYFDLKEYDRAAFFLKECTSPKCYFLYMYSRYLADEKRKLDKASDSIGPPDHLENEHLKTLRIELSKKYANRELDGYSLYLYGVILKKLDLLKDAIEILVESLQVEPMHWGTWQELVPLITDREMLVSLSLPSHWIKQFFVALVYLELQLNEEALKIYQDMEENGFHKSTYIVAHIAAAYHNMRDVDAALNSFSELQTLDPYRLENMDTFSNLLYVKEMRYDLAHLAHKCCDIDKYRVETCCVIGNYYSLRSQHEKAVLYFQRSIKLNPLYLSAWTLMGHEFMEMKNTNAAIQAYRQALEVNKRDYRAWYGLGQTYEILKMPYYCLYYYRNAQKLRPNDSRMIMALGESYEKLDRLQEAKKCFWKAHRVGDIEGASLLKLAKLHERLGEEEQAAGAYNEFIKEANAQGLGKSYSYEGQSEAYKYLANYYLKHEQLDAAYQAAQICSEYTETREEAKAILKHIQQLRQERPNRQEVRMDDTFGSIQNDSFQSHNNTPIMNFPPVMNLRFNTP